MEKKMKATNLGLSKFLDRKKIDPEAAQGVTGSKFIAETFKGYGITHVFFVEAILRKSLVEMEALGIRRILAHSEKAAAYMADGYARVKRSPGICMSQSVGAANLAAGLQDAYLGLSPVIAITGKKNPIYQHRNAYQEIYHPPLFEPVTKFNVVVNDQKQLPILLRQAFREATTGVPRPVHLDVTGHVGQTTDNYVFDLGEELIVEKSFTRFPAHRLTPEKELLQAVADLLNQSDRPVLIAGGGAIASGAGPEIEALAEKQSIPVATSLNGKGVISWNHPLSLGVAGSYSRWCANRVISEADLVIFVGTHTGDMLTNDWTVPRPGTPVIQIDLDPAELGRNYPNVVGLMGDAKKSLEALSELLDTNTSRDQWIQTARGAVQEWEEEMEPFRSSGSVPIRPERLCKELTHQLPSDSILVADTGYSSIWTGVMVDLMHPDQRYIKAAGSLGWAFPASLGAKCAAPDKPVICFTGDGGFWYHLSELETAVRNGIHTITVVNNNSCLGQCLSGVEKAYGDRTGNKGEMCRFLPTDFARLAQDMGACGIRVENPEDIAGALQKALSENAPVVVEVVTDENAKAPFIPAY